MSRTDKKQEKRKRVKESRRKQLQRREEKIRAEDLACEAFRLLTRFGDPNQAEECARKALNHDPDCISALEVLVHSLYKRQQFREALIHAQKWHEFLPDRPEPVYYLAILHRRISDWEGAIPHARAYLAMTCVPSTARKHEKWRKIIASILRSQPPPPAPGPDARSRPRETVYLVGEARVKQAPDHAELIPPPAPPEQSPGEPAGLGRPPRASVAAPLPAGTGRLPIVLEPKNGAVPAWFSSPPTDDIQGFELHNLFQRLSLRRGFDELVCLGSLSGVEHFYYQIETVRKVLKQFRGRAVLSDEVGLGKTIEAGMVAKEYLMRGLARRVLILVPASLVAQWREEMLTKFGIAFSTTEDRECHANPERFWERPLIIASLHTARSERHFEAVTAPAHDLVIVDEAHYLKNRASRSWQLVNALKKTFLLLLTATPVQNNLVELYNLITLIKPGLLQTEASFKRTYVRKGEPTVPENRETLRALVREVMIRNTRSLADVQLPPRFAATLAVEPSTAERELYDALTSFVRGVYASLAAEERLGLRHLLMQAGSSPAALAEGLQHVIERGRAGGPAADARGIRDLWQRARAVAMPAKTARLLEILQKGGPRKVIVFSHARKTLEHLSAVLSDAGIRHTHYHGGLPGTEKEHRIENFRNSVDVLLSSESGGEGRNIQFCHTMVNFDLPWNPMRIEQRIGRIHRIGQTNDVYVFNLCLTDSVEDYLLRVLDGKIRMFELVIGEIDTILGFLDRRQDFADLVLDIWAGSKTGSEAAEAFEGLGRDLLEARAVHEKIKQTEQAIFGEDLEA